MPYSQNPHLPRIRMQTVRLLRHGWSTRKVARHFGFAHSTIVRWHQRVGWADDNLVPTRSSRPHQHPYALTQEVVSAIVTQRKKRKRCAEVIHQELLQQGIVVSLSSVKRTLQRKGLIRTRSPWKRWHFSLPRPKTEKAGDLVQIDTIHLVPKGAPKFYVYTLIDVASRWTYAMAVERINTHASFQFVKIAQCRASFSFRMIQSDHGSEFSTWFTEQMRASGIEHRHSRVRQCNDNGHVERFNRTLQEECLVRVPCSPDAYQQAIRRYLPYYNNQRLHLGINLQTPLQVVRSY